MSHIADILARYESFGIKASGGAGDRQCGAWLADELARVGYAVTHQPFETGWFEAEQSVLHVGDSLWSVIPHGDHAAEASGPIVHVHDTSGGDIAGRIVLLHLPHARWSSAKDPRVVRALASVVAGDPAAVLLVTHGPTGHALALNRPAVGEASSIPVAILAPQDASRIADGSPGRLRIAGKGGRRTATNLIARLDRGHARDLVVSTPRSGWFGCVGERGPGLAIWLMLAEWLATADLAANVTIFCSSGHERDHAGASAFLADGAPPPSRTALWLHLGANCATRDWHEAGGRMMPLDSADAQRFLMVSAQHLTHAKRCFSRLAGLEHPYAVAGNGAGELADIAAAGYPSVAGIFGGHRFHHSVADDGRTVRAELVDEVLRACREFVRETLSATRA